MQRYHALLMPLMLALLSYAGVDGYGKIEEYRAANGKANVTVTVEAPSGNQLVPHEHPDKVRSNAEIDARITAALDKHRCDYHGVC